MHFLTPDECKAWMSQWRQPVMDRGSSKLTLPYAKHPSRAFFIALWLARKLAYRRPVLLWVTEAHVGESNWHLYYRLRQSYGDFRRLEEAPGHLCLDYESDDLASLLQLTMLNSWDAMFLSELGYVSLKFSHDGFFDVFSEDAALVEDVRKHASEDPSAAG